MTCVLYTVFVHYLLFSVFLHLCLHFSVVHETMLPASLSSLSSANPELC